MKSRKKRGAYFTMLMRGMWNAKSRILAIFGIVALGVGFLFGMISTAPDMYITADNYFDSTRLYDVRLRSNYGFTDKDLSVVSSTDGVMLAAGAYEADAIVSVSAQTYVARFHSLPDNGEDLNRVALSEGRMPQSSDECVVDVGAVMGEGSIEVGDKLRFADKESEESFGVAYFTVVGKVTSALYCSAEKGSSDKGSGVVEAIIYAEPEAFSSSVYTSIYVRAENAEEVNCFGEEYSESIDLMISELKNSLDSRRQERFDEVSSEAETLLSSARITLGELQTQREEKLEWRSKIYSDRIKYYNAWLSLEEGETFEGMSRAELKQTVDQLQRNIEVMDDLVTRLSIQVSATQTAIAEGEKTVASLKPTNIYFYDRYDNAGFNSFQINAEKMNDIAKVFPVFFFLVALLVSLTTMTRMVEEERLVIGAMKAIGYGEGAIAFKYVFYSLLSGALGSALGLAVGGFALPTVIYKAYSILYSIPKLELHFNLLYAALSALIMISGTVLATYIAVRATLAEKPAALLRPKAQPDGKRIFLERVTPVWRALSFGGKVTARNLFLYKKRFFMTVIGVAGCMALLLTGFGLKDSVGSVVGLQYGKIYNYNTAIVRYGDAHSQTFESALKQGGVKDLVWISMTSGEVTSEHSDESVTAYLTVPEDASQTGLAINLMDARSGDELVMNDRSVFVTEKMSEMLGVSTGDSVDIMIDGEQYRFTVDAVVENYINSYVYIGNEIYADTVGHDPEYLVVLGSVDGSDAEERKKISTALLSDPKTMSVDYTDSNEERFGEIVSKLDYVVGILILAAAVLAFTVLYNLMNVNISERRREIATVKVLGFFDKETDSYIFREIYILSVIGSVIGVLGGVILHRFVVKTIEMELAMFSHVISPLSYLLSVALTLVFTVAVTLVMKRKLRKIDMVESLKSAE